MATTKWRSVWAVFVHDTPYLCSIAKTKQKSIRQFVEDAKRGKRIKTNKPWSWWYRRAGLRCRRMSIAMEIEL